MAEDEKVKDAQEWAVREIEKEDKKPVEHVPFLVTDTFIAEECYNSESDEAFFMIRFFDSENIQRMDEIEYGGKVYRPLVNPTLRKKLVLMPTGVEETSFSEIYDEAWRLVTRFYECEEQKIDELKLLVGVTIADSWFLDRFNMDIPGLGGFAPVISIRGPSGSGKDRLMNALRLLSYRPFYDVSTTRIPSLYRPLDQWQGTLCLSEMDFHSTDAKSELTHYLNCRCYGVPISRQNPDNPRVNQVFKNFGLTIVTQRLGWEDNALEDRTLPFYCERTEKDIPTEVLDKWVEEGKIIQNKLLYLRLMFYEKFNIDKSLRIRGVRDHRLIAASLPLIALGRLEPRFLTNLVDTLQKLEKKRREVKAMSIDGIIVNRIFEAYSAGLVGEWNRIKYVGKERKRNEATGEETIIPLQVSDLADELKMTGRTIRYHLNSLQLHPAFEKLPKVIRIDRAYRPIFFDENRVQIRFLEFVPDYAPSEKTPLLAFKGEALPDIYSCEDVTHVTDVTHDMCVHPAETGEPSTHASSVTSVTSVTENPPESHAPRVPPLQGGEEKKKGENETVIEGLGGV
ncbi:MAG: hypothetical protein QW334_00230 [Thermofilum sp.]